jgi:hypothetical protein
MVLAADESLQLPSFEIILTFLTKLHVWADFAAIEIVGIIPSLPTNTSITIVSQVSILPFHYHCM